jgi:hypothetical protein
VAGGGRDGDGPAEVVGDADAHAVDYARVVARSRQRRSSMKRSTMSASDVISATFH